MAVVAGSPAWTPVALWTGGAAEGTPNGKDYGENCMGTNPVSVSRNIKFFLLIFIGDLET